MQRLFILTVFKAKMRNAMLTLNKAGNRKQWVREELIKQQNWCSLIFGFGLCTVNFTVLDPSLVNDLYVLMSHELSPAYMETSRAYVTHKIASLVWAATSDQGRHPQWNLSHKLCSVLSKFKKDQDCLERDLWLAIETRGYYNCTLPAMDAM